MTPAIELLKSLGIEHRVVEYDHDTHSGSYGEEAAAALGLDTTTVFKTLLATADEALVVVGVVPVAARLDLKAIAAATGGKRARMTESSDAGRRTGYVVGGISPFGQRQRLTTVVDEWATALDEMHVSAGRRGLEVAVAPAAFTTALDAAFAPIAAWP